MTGEFIAVGVAKGKFVDGSYNHEIIVETYYNAPGRTLASSSRTICREIRTGIMVTDETALTFNVWFDPSISRVNGYPTWNSQGAWRVQMWRGYWDNLAIVPTKWTHAPETEYGQEIYAYRGDLDSVIAPLNFGHKANFIDSEDVSGPWHNDVLTGSPLHDRSGYRYDSPLSVTDRRYDDYTSMSSCTPVRNLCK